MSATTTSSNKFVKCCSTARTVRNWRQWCSSRLHQVMYLSITLPILHEIHHEKLLPRRFDDGRLCASNVFGIRRYPYISYLFWAFKRSCRAETGEGMRTASHWYLIELQVLPDTVCHWHVMDCQENMGTGRMSALSFFFIVTLCLISNTLQDLRPSC